ncbi:MAG: hypothetical protein CMJ64_15795 [Planctomycetaceae bacterium]|nr:hypothetical protein [Planctomycetaceae bacterium]
MASRSRDVVNHCHQNIRLSDEAAAILAQLDGTRDRKALLQALPDETGASPDRERLDRALAELRDNALLTG